MKQILRDIIEDQKAFLHRQNAVERAFPERLLRNELVVVISGVRRCGKSVLLQQIRQRMPKSDCFLNFDDDRLATFNQQHFQALYEVFIELYGEQECFFFDEIQNVEGWEHFVKRLYNMGKKAFVTGSNARMLSRELGTLLTGCYVSYELFPFSFAEALTFAGEQRLLENRDGSRNRSALQSRFREYLYDGGMPMYLSMHDPQVLKTMYDNILYRDVLVRNQISNERELKEMVYFLMSNMHVVSSQYWNQVHGFSAEDVKKDLEGLQTMRNLARNMAFMIKAIAMARETIGCPTMERGIATSFPDGK